MRFLRMWWKIWENGVTQSIMDISMPSMISSSLQLSAFQSASSLSEVKGNAWFPHIQSMWMALVEDTFPCGSKATRMVFFVKFHFSLMYFMTEGSMIEGSWTLNHGISICSCSNLCLFWLCCSIDWSMIGIHTILYRISGRCCDSLNRLSRIIISSWEISISDINSNTCFLFSISRWTCLCQNEKKIPFSVWSYLKIRSWKVLDLWTNCHFWGAIIERLYVISCRNQGPDELHVI